MAHSLSAVFFETCLLQPRRGFWT